MDVYAMIVSKVQTSKYINAVIPNYNFEYFDTTELTLCRSYRPHYQWIKENSKIYKQIWYSGQPHSGMVLFHA